MSADHKSAQRADSAARGTPRCAAPSCWREASRVEFDEREAVLCEIHRKAFLGVTS